jgi:hypothetical protein
MPSFAQQFSLEEGFLQQRVISLAAYALSLGGRAFEFPVGDVSPDERALYPVHVPDDQLRAESATAMLGAAGAAMVVDQQVGLALTGAAADRYWSAGHYYGAFLWSGLGVPTAGAFEVAMNLVEGGPSGTIRQPAALVPEQLSYLAVSMALAGEPSLAIRLFSFVPLTTVIGPYALPVSLLQAAFSENLENQSGVREVAQRLLVSFDLSQRGLEDQPSYRRLLPWNIGLSPEPVLLIAAFLARNVLAPQNLAITGPYANVLLGAALSAAEIIRQPDRFRDISVQDALGSWLEGG